MFSYLFLMVWCRWIHDSNSRCGFLKLPDWTKYLEFNALSELGSASNNVRPPERTLICRTIKLCCIYMFLPWSQELIFFFHAVGVLFTNCDESGFDIKKKTMQPSSCRGRKKANFDYQKTDLFCSNVLMKFSKSVW